MPELFDESNTEEMLEEAGERGTDMSRLEMNSVSNGGGLDSISTIEVCLPGCLGELGARMAGDIGYLLEGIGGYKCDRRSITWNTYSCFREQLYRSTSVEGFFRV